MKEVYHSKGVYFIKVTKDIKYYVFHGKRYSFADSSVISVKEKKVSVKIQIHIFKLIRDWLTTSVKERTDSDIWYSFELAYEDKHFNLFASMTLDLDSIDSDYLTLVVIPNILIPHIDVLFLERDWTRQQYRIVGKGWEDCMIQHHLSYDEWQCLYLSARGDSIKSIADHLGISESKVKHLRNKGYEILGVNTIVQATEIISFFRLRPLYSLL